MSVKSERTAYKLGFADGRADHWALDLHYPRPTTECAKSVTLSDGTVITGNATTGWKPPFAKALTVDDAVLLVELWRRPVQMVPVEDE